VEFWTTKLTRNRQRDQEQGSKLRAMGWRVFTVWECQLVATHRDKTLDELYQAIIDPDRQDESIKPPIQTKE